MDPASIPPITNNFNQWPNWNFTSYYGVYCTNGVTIHGEQNVLIGTVYIGIYLFFMSLYIPSLIVIRRSPLFQHACYKLMFSIGVFDLMGGFMYSFIPGILSIMEANYCGHNMLLIVVGHLAHGALGLFCNIGLKSMCRNILKINPEKLFGGRRVLFWSIPVLAYGVPAILLDMFLCVFGRQCLRRSRFYKNPNEFGKCGTIALQLCSGSTSIIYLKLNKTIRSGVKELLFGKSGEISPTLPTGEEHELEGT